MAIWAKTSVDSDTDYYSIIIRKMAAHGGMREISSIDTNKQRHFNYPIAKSIGKFNSEMQAYKLVLNLT